MFRPSQFCHPDRRRPSRILARFGPPARLLFSDRSRRILSFLKACRCTVETAPVACHNLEGEDQAKRTGGTMQATQDLTRGQMLMMLLAAPGVRGKAGEPIQGTTRLQKLLFLMEHEAKLKPTKGDDFNFSAWKFGPVSKELYDDLEKLENLGLLESEPVSEPSKTELDEYGLSFDDLMGEEESQSRDSFEEKRYRLSEKGLKWIREREL